LVAIAFEGVLHRTHRALKLVSFSKRSQGVACDLLRLGIGRRDNAFCACARVGQQAGGLGVGGLGALSGRLSQGVCLGLSGISKLVRSSMGLRLQLLGGNLDGCGLSFGVAQE
jgi:hypothetical protein